MKSTQIIYIFLAFIAILMWNGFLIQRDTQLFNSYNHETAKEKYCKNLAHWHPDCNVE